MPRSEGLRGEKASLLLFVLLILIKGIFFVYSPRQDRGVVPSYLLSSAHYLKVNSNGRDFLLRSPVGRRRLAPHAPTRVPAEPSGDPATRYPGQPRAKQAALYPPPHLPVFPGVTVLAAEHAVDADDVLFAFQTWNRAFPPVWRLRALIGQASAIVLQNRVSFPESTAKKRGTQPLDLQWFSSALEASFRKVKDCH